ALYLLNEFSMPEKVGFFYDITQAKNGVPIASQLAMYFFLPNSHKSIPSDLQQFEQCARIAYALYTYTKKDDELIVECLHCWFCTFIRLYTAGDIFTN
ncbi:hypothetical protein FO512_32145, partial [Bacillus cereus]|nr:hypothetical protein [Bacillus cereus]